MSVFIPDASVAVKWIFSEARSAEALKLLQDGAEICAPRLLRIEVASSIVRRFRTGEITDEQARARLAHSDVILSEKRVSYVEDQSLLKRAAEIALAVKHALQDCLYIACAEREAGVLVTADLTLHKRAAAHFDFVKLL
jgi:predicted nucleic acid-binding protein